MNKKVLGLIDATDHNEALIELTKYRCVAAVPFGARYRLIDFILSSMVSSGISNVAVFPNYNCRSLWNHLGSGKNWDLMRKRDGLFILSPDSMDMELEKMGSFHYFKNHLEYFENSSQKYVLIAKGNILANIDFNSLFDFHLESDADITQVVSQEGPIDMFFLSKALLVSILEDPELLQYGSFAYLLERNPNSYELATFFYDGFAHAIDSVLSYFHLNLELINLSFSEQLLTKRTIRTKEKDDPPTIYKKHAHVSRSLIANGCIIDGYVENSILFRGVNIQKEAVVKNCIIMPKGTIGQSTFIENVILDKKVQILDEVTMLGQENRPLIISKKQVIPFQGQENENTIYSI